MNEEEKFNLARDKSELVQAKDWEFIRKYQLEMIVGYAKNNNYDGNDIKAMLKLIGKTDEWKQEFERLQKERNNNKE